MIAKWFRTKFTLNIENILAILNISCKILRFMYFSCQVANPPPRNPSNARQSNATNSNRHTSWLRHCRRPWIFLRNRYVRCKHGNLGRRKFGNGPTSMDFYVKFSPFSRRLGELLMKNLATCIFQVWQCGGSLLMIPCSHIGHLFRKSTYSFGDDKDLIKHRNNVRILETWLDEYKEFYYAIFPSESSSLWTWIRGSSYQ